VPGYYPGYYGYPCGYYGGYCGPAYYGYGGPWWVAVGAGAAVGVVAAALGLARRIPRRIRRPRRFPVVDFEAAFMDSMVVDSTAVDSTAATVKPGPRRPDRRFCSGPGRRSAGAEFFSEGLNAFRADIFQSRKSAAVGPSPDQRFPASAGLARLGLAWRLPPLLPLRTLDHVSLPAPALG